MSRRPSPGDRAVGVDEATARPDVPKRDERVERPGKPLVLDRLAQLVLVLALRAHGEQHGSRRAEWLTALADPRIGGALRVMHANVGRRWKVEELAALAGMSRSAFALQLKRAVNKAPLDYLVEWRMSLARDALRRGARSITEPTFDLGYESESAFSTAFRRVVGSSPPIYRSEQRAQAAPPPRPVAGEEPVGFAGRGAREPDGGGTNRRAIAVRGVGPSRA